MPESVLDRPTRAHEYIFLLSKQPTYYYDAVAVAEPAVSTHGSGNGFKRAASLSRDGRGSDEPWTSTGGTRNRRSWWVINPRPFPGAHYAVFPEAIPEIAILAGTSARGCCPTCRAPWRRVVERESRPNVSDNNGKHDGTVYRTVSGGVWNDARRRSDRGWEPTCRCGREDVVPCVCLDPFAGSGTTGRVATKHGRDAILIELNKAYIDLADERVSGVQTSFSSVL
jgi:hypothetical protein